MYPRRVAPIKQQNNKKSFGAGCRFGAAARQCVKPFTFFQVAS